MKRIADPIETTDKCKYGCGQVAKFKNGSGNLMCSNSPNRCPAVLEKNSKGVKSSGVDYREKYKNLTDDAKDRMNWNKGNTSADFSLNGKGNHKGVLIKERGHQCESCSLSEWMNNPIPLELEHIDGNNKNNTKENLKLLCPNCHSLTKTYRGKNINGYRKVSKEELIESINKSVNIRQALISVGLTPKAGNYKTCYDLIYGGLAKLVSASDLSPDA